MSYAKKVLKLYYTYPPKKQDKEYHVIAEAAADGSGYHVYGLNGPRGRASTRQSKTKTPVSLSAAEALYEDLVEAKRKKGYTTDSKGVPHSGISHSMEIVSGTVAPSATATLPPLRPMEWTHVTNPVQFEAMLEDDEFVVQEMPVGIRVLLEVTSSVRMFDVVTGKSWSLPTSVQAEVRKVFKECLIDGTYDTTGARLAILDGYELNKKSKANMDAPFSTRIKALAQKVKAAALKHLDVILPHEEEEKFEIVCALQDRGRPRVMLHKNQDSYDPDAPPTTGPGSVVVYDF